MLTDGLTVIVKRSCPTCTLVEPVLHQLAAGPDPLTVYSQDDPQFPAGIPDVQDDTSLQFSYQLDIETVPTLIRVENGQEVNHGDPLVILEAMKMENVLNSPTDGVVTQIHVSQGESVDKGQVLIAIN